MRLPYHSSKWDERWCDFFSLQRQRRIFEWFGSVWLEAVRRWEVCSVTNGRDGCWPDEQAFLLYWFSFWTINQTMRKPCDENSRLSQGPLFARIAAVSFLPLCDVLCLLALFALAVCGMWADDKLQDKKKAYGMWEWKTTKRVRAILFVLRVCAKPSRKSSNNAILRQR